MKDAKPGFIRRTFSFIGAAITWLRNTLANLLFLLLMLFIVVGLWPDQETGEMPSDIALRLNLSGTLVDQRSYVDPLAQLLNANNQDFEAETLVADVIKAIDAARDDNRINSLVLELGQLSNAGLSKMLEIGVALDRFRESGKPIFAVSDSYSQAQYFLASYATTIYLSPMGNVAITGFANYGNYFKDALDKLAVNAHVFRVGQFKDAVEPLLRNDMSNASKEHNRKLLEELWDTYQINIESLRNLKPGTIHDYADNLDQYLQKYNGDAAKLALGLGLVDEVLNTQQVSQNLREFIGQAERGNTYRHIDYRHYVHRLAPPASNSATAIGVLVARGTIVDGEQPEGTIGSVSMAQMIDNASNNKRLKGLVIRIDSPGGSAFASEEIRTAIKSLKQQRGDDFPVYISMGSVAASGGYWIASAGDQIWATPTTITGSIGVFGIIPTFEKTLAKIGVHTDGVATTQFAGMLRPDRPMTAASERLFQAGVDHIYERFLNLVADARGQSRDDVHAIAQGRVWTGTMAKDIGLVDELGNLEDVVAATAAAAGLSDYDIVPVQRTLSPKEMFLRQLSQQVSAWLPSLHSASNGALALQAALQPWTDSLGTASLLLQDPQHVYANCLTCNIEM